MLPCLKSTFISKFPDTSSPLNTRIFMSSYVPSTNMIPAFGAPPLSQMPLQSLSVEFHLLSPDLLILPLYFYVYPVSFSLCKGKHPISCSSSFSKPPILVIDLSFHYCFYFARQDSELSKEKANLFYHNLFFLIALPISVSTISPTLSSPPALLGRHITLFYPWLMEALK